MLADWLQSLIAGDALASPDGLAVGRAILNDEVLVVYNLDDPPPWLATILAARDQEGNVGQLRMTLAMDEAAAQRAADMDDLRARAGLT